MSRFFNFASVVTFAIGAARVINGNEEGGERFLWGALAIQLVSATLKIVGNNLKAKRMVEAYQANWPNQVHSVASLFGISKEKPLPVPEVISGIKSTMELMNLFSALRNSEIKPATIYDSDTDASSDDLTVRKFKDTLNDSDSDDEEEEEDDGGISILIMKHEFPAVPKEPEKATTTTTTSEQPVHAASKGHPDHELSMAEKYRDFVDAALQTNLRPCETSPLEFSRLCNYAMESQMLKDAGRSWKDPFEGFDPNADRGVHLPGRDQRPIGAPVVVEDAVSTDKGKEVVD